MENKKLSTKELSLISLVTAFLCITGPLTMPIPFSPVQLSLMNLTLYLSLYVLGAKKSALSYLLYVFMGFIGLPVFSGFGAGLGKIAGPTGGYIVGFIAVPLLAGKYIEQFPKGRIKHILAMLISSILCYALAAVWLSIQSGSTLLQAVLAGILPFLPGDIAKMVIAAMVGPTIQRLVTSSGVKNQ